MQEHQTGAQVSVPDAGVIAVVAAWREDDWYLLRYEHPSALLLMGPDGLPVTGPSTVETWFPASMVEVAA